MPISSDHLASTTLELKTLEPEREAGGGFPRRGSPSPWHEQFIALGELWGFSPPTLARLRAVIESEEISRPLLGRYQRGVDSSVLRLEETATRLFRSTHALAVHSGTSALESALAACAVGPGDEVLVPAFTFVATALAVVGVGAVPVVCPIDDSLGLAPDHLEAFLSSRTKAVIAVHMLGGPARLTAIHRFARRNALFLIEDAAQAVGATYAGRFVGTIGDVGCLSLSSYKRIGAGEGGLVLTNNGRLFERARVYHDGSTGWRRPRYQVPNPSEPDFCGTNLRMSELEGVLNLIELMRLAPYTDQCQRVKSRLTSGLDRGVFRSRRLDRVAQDAGHYLCLLAHTPTSADLAVRALEREGVTCLRYGDPAPRDGHLAAYWERVFARALHHNRLSSQEAYFRRFPNSFEAVHSARRLIDRTVIVTINETWTVRDCERIARTLKAVARNLREGH